jgi:hypothetical protein
MWTLAFGHHEKSHADARLWANARGDGGVREELAAGVKGADSPAASSIQILVVGACYPPEVPVARALLAKDLIPAAAQVRQIGRASRRGNCRLACSHTRHTATPFVS